MTGRKGRVVQNAGGKIGYESRAEQDQSLENINLIGMTVFLSINLFLFYTILHEDAELDTVFHYFGL